MRTVGPFKDYRVEPLGGALNLRASDGQVPRTDFRIVLNASLDESRRRCRMGGWQKLLADSPFGFENQDFHDQLTQCLTYYETHEARAQGGNELVDYSYPYWFPDQFTGSESTPYDPIPHCGYASDHYAEYSSSPTTNSYFIEYPFTGAPYVQEGPVYGPCNTGYPDYYQGSYFYLGYVAWEPGDLVPGYSWGTPIGVYSTPFSYWYNYCGDDLLLRPGCREAITFLAEVSGTDGPRRLLAGTKSKLAVMIERAGNWRLIADGMGGPYSYASNCEDCPDRRWKHAQVGNLVFFANGTDSLIYWQIDNGPKGCDLTSVEYVMDLIALGIDKPRVVASWKGFLLIANVSVEGIRYPNRIYWSDYNAPLSFSPDPGFSLAGFMELGAGEEVMAIEPLGNQLRVYCRRGTQKIIYAPTIVQDQNEVFSFGDRIYSGPDGLHFVNSLVNTGDSHVFLSEESICVLGEYDRVPTRIEWLHEAAGAIYKGVSQHTLGGFTGGMTHFGPINKDECGQAVGGFDTERKAIWFSWPTDTNVCPNMSLVLYPRYTGATLVDHGFTAFCMHRPDYRSALRDWLAEQKICAASTMSTVKEGVAYAEVVDTDMTGAPAYIRNYGEDPDAPVDPDSVCANVAGVSLDDLCTTCEPSALFVMACASDRTIKEFTPDQYYRERYLDLGYPDYECPYTLPGFYAQDGYTSLLQSDATDYGRNERKIQNKINIEFVANVQTTPNELHCELAYGAQAGCMVWSETPTQLLECLTHGEAVALEAQGIRPELTARFNFFKSGIFLAYRFWVEGTGGGACFNSVTHSVKLAEGMW